MRIEDRSIKDVSFAVSDLLKGIELPAGSVVLMGSMTSVAKLGAQSYAHELSRSVRILGERLGTRIGIHPLIPVPICGINNTRVVRNLLELDVWMEKIGETEAGIFRNTREKLVETVRRHGEGAKRYNEEFILVMPAGLNSRDTITIRSTGWKGMPLRVYPLSMEAESLMVVTMVRDLCENCGVELSQNIDFSRKGGSAEKTTGYVIIGASGAGKIGKALEEKGRQVTVIGEGGWKANIRGVEEMEKALKSQDMTGKVAVFMPLDNHSYYAESEEGLRSFPEKDGKGVWHVGGRVEVATFAGAKNTMKNCGPIMSHMETNKKLIMAPVPKFYSVSCCANDAHCTNVGISGYRAGMLDDLGRVGEAMKAVCMEERVRNYKVVYPAEMLKLTAQLEEREVEKIMGKDGVHLSSQGYALLAESIIAMVESKESVFGGEKREREEEYVSHFPIVPGRTEEWIYKELSGKGDRRDSDEWRSFRGGRGDRGGYGRRGRY